MAIVIVNAGASSMFEPDADRNPRNAHGQLAAPGNAQCWRWRDALPGKAHVRRIDAALCIHRRRVRNQVAFHGSARGRLKRLDVDEHPAAATDGR